MYVGVAYVRTYVYMMLRKTDIFHNYCMYICRCLLTYMYVCTYTRKCIMFAANFGVGTVLVDIHTSGCTGDVI